MPEDIKLEQRTRFIDLVSRLNELDEVDFKEMYNLGTFDLGIIDLSYFSDLADIPGDTGKMLIELYFRERACALKERYAAADRYKTAQNNILEKRRLISKLISLLQYRIKSPLPPVIYL